MIEIEGNRERKRARKSQSSDEQFLGISDLAPFEPTIYGFAWFTISMGLILLFTY